MSTENTNLKINYVSKELNAFEKLLLEDADGVGLDTVVKSDGTPFLIEVDWYAIVNVTSEKVEGGEYNKYLIVDKRTGETYTTSSKSFGQKFEHIMETLNGWSDRWLLAVRKADSKNRKGAQFLTCSVRPYVEVQETREVPFEN